MPLEVSCVPVFYIIYKFLRSSLAQFSLLAKGFIFDVRVCKIKISQKLYFLLFLLNGILDTFFFLPFIFWVDRKPTFRSCFDIKSSQSLGTIINSFFSCRPHFKMCNYRWYLQVESIMLTPGILHGTSASRALTMQQMHDLWKLWILFSGLWRQINCTSNLFTALTWQSLTISWL
jgi:hypothetical protein